MLQSPNLPRNIFFFALVLIEIPLMFGFSVHTGVFALGARLFALSGLRLIQLKKFSPSNFPTLDHKVFYALLAWTVGGWLILVVLDYYAINFKLYDTGIFANEMNNLLEKGSYFSSIMNIHGFADHFTPSLLVLIPFYYLVPSFLWYSFLKILAFAASAFVLIALGKEILSKDSKWVYVAPLLWLVNDYFGSSLHWEFQPSAFAPPFVLLAFLFAIRHQTFRMFLCLLFLAGLKEHLPLVWVSLGLFLYVFLQQKRLGVLTIVLGLVLGLLIYFVIMPSFFEGWGSPLHHQSRFNPLAMLPQKVNFVTLCLLSVGLLPLFEWKTLIFILPAFGISLVSKMSNMVQFSYHQDMPLSVIFVGVIYGIAILENQNNPIRRIPRNLLQFLFFGILALSLFFNVSYPQQHIWNAIPSTIESETLAEIKRYRAEENYASDVLWTSETVGMYFVDHPDLKSLRGLDDSFHDKPFAETQPHSILVTDTPDTSNIHPDSHTYLLKQLAQQVEAGNYRELSGFQRLKVYQSVR